MVSAQHISRNLVSARAAWGLSQKQLAHRAGVSEVEVKTSERSGRVELSTLAALAGAMGGTLDDLLAGRRFWVAPGIALKSASEVTDPAMLAHGLSRASAAARDYHALASFLELPELWMERGAKLGPIGVEGDVIIQAERLAQRVREELVNPLEPLASVRAAMARLGVVTFFTEFGTEEVDGAMWRVKGSPPCVVANARARSGLVTAARMTFAHELCHALFDRPKQVDTGLVEIRTPRSTQMEKRANAFAAWLLAPRESIRRFLQESGLTPDERPTQQHLLSLSLHFGIGVEAMAHHLVSCGYWTREIVFQNRVLRSPRFASTDDQELHPTPTEEMVPVERRGALLDLATQALAQGKLTVGRWRELLGLGGASDWRLLLQERHIDIDFEHYLHAAP
jgi:Zn-dependent peptidase ImmA (M78 family)/transcriptional regulator with XRE-family HTH domain